MSDRHETKKRRIRTRIQERSDSDSGIIYKKEFSNKEYPKYNL